MATDKVLIESSLFAVSHAQMKELHAQFESGSLNKHHLQAFLRHQNPFGLDSVVMDWARVYELLGMKDEFEEANLPGESTTDLWQVPVIKGVTSNKVVRAIRWLGVNMYLYTEDLDTGVTKNDRDPSKDGSYLVRFLKTIEADPELHDRSANALTEEDVKGITLLERLLLELGYFLATENHLDLENMTLCAGSRNSDGRVPSVYWSTGLREVYVLWYDPGNSFPSLHARAVVS